MPDPEGVDRRTSLAGERTLLAWWRTGFTSFAVALAVGRVLPGLSPHSTGWPYAVIGVAFALYGIAMIAYGTVRIEMMNRELGVAEPDRRGTVAAVLLAVVGVVLGIATAVLILIE